ncbi:tetraacyldisaccharide 4'-kinase [Mucilaginibacter xinganensis]|uniref:Tetraacyldisaccharide 4'-kinase n=1 Tax=Mucilaginibacter xinganensis TaxID=1234841 RepID=A0A223P1M8_9SPHI|nr:tetraacyldisaccharide 4'-kinase [Mucilaginibacter xinganensis]ASU35731.1 tetraacyldisaccharide 4'-kinase [Mucilaginibacter xinganensis]
MKYLRWLLLPFSLIYGLVVIIRNWLYDAGLFKSYRFTKPVISVGNLEVGGAGKSPMTEYLIRLLKSDYKLATLSRGYGRETKGYIVADRENRESGFNNQGPATTKAPLSRQIGDEPAQFKQKFPDITVAVCEARVEGLKQLLPNHDIILMDDAYQHRAVEPGLSFLLFDYNRVNAPHFLLPAGNMREPMSGRWRAQVIIVSKCPASLTDAEKTDIAHKIEPLPYQQLFFTSIAYQGLQTLSGKQSALTIDNDTTVFLLTGIANAQPLLQYLSNSTPHIIHHNYPDHHPFTLKNIAKLVAEFAAHPAQKKIIVTTEKDAQRLDESWLNQVRSTDGQLPVFVIPIKVEFLNGTGPQFDKIVIEYVREHTENHSIH